MPVYNPTFGSFMGELLSKGYSDMAVAKQQGFQNKITNDKHELWTSMRDRFQKEMGSHDPNAQLRAEGFLMRLLGNEPYEMIKQSPEGVTQQYPFEYRWGNSRRAPMNVSPHSLNPNRLPYDTPQMPQEPQPQASSANGSTAPNYSSMVGVPGAKRSMEALSDFLFYMPRFTGGGN